MHIVQKTEFLLAAGLFLIALFVLAAGILITSFLVLVDSVSQHLQGIDESAQEINETAQQVLEAIQNLGGSAPPSTTLQGYLTFDGVKDNAMITDIQTCSIKALIQDAMKNAAVLAAGVVLNWTVDNTAMATIASDPTDASGLSAILTPIGPLGIVNVTASASDGSVVLTGALSINGSAAVTGSLQFTAVNPTPATPVAPAAPAAPAQSS